SEERVAVPSRSVAEAGALAQRPGKPCQLAARQCEILVENAGERRDDARRSVAPLRPDLAVAVFAGLPPLHLGPVGEPVLRHGQAAKRLGDTVDVSECEHAARKAVGGADEAPALALELLPPEPVGITPRVEPLHARGHVETELAAGEDR